MSSLDSRHPSEEQLLGLLDGELAAGQAAAMRTHLEACWQCRTEMEGLEKAIARCVEYRKQMQELLPEPPKAWADLYPRFAEIDAEQAGPRWYERFFAMPRWVPVAVALALSFGIYQRLSLAPSAQAAVLLQRAVTAAESRHETSRRIQIRTRNQRLVRTLPAIQTAASDVESEALAARFRAAHYDWNDPLSARAFEQWRNRLDAKQDEVADANGQIRIHTSTSSSELADATLALRSGDLRPTEGTFRFRDNEVVEITELPADTAPARETAVAPSAVLETPAVTDQAPPQATPEAVVPVDAALELKVVAALQRVGADLGESVEVRRSADRIEVRGVGIDPDRQQKIQDAVAGLPQVSVQFTDAAPSQRVIQQSQAVAGNVDAGLQAKLEERAGGKDRLEQLSSEALDRGESVMARVYALHRLAERFSAASESSMSEADHATMNNLLREHAFALRSQTADLQAKLLPLVGAADAPAGAGLPAAWQLAAEDIFRTARRTERLMAAALGGAAIDVPADALPAQLAASLAELKAKSDAYFRMLDNRRN